MIRTQQGLRNMDLLPKFAVSMTMLSGLMCVACGLKGSDRDTLHGRDLILITVDTLRADAVGAYNPDAGPKPTIDSLAERGLLFSQALAPAPRTTPSLATLLSGRSPKQHGSREVGMAMSNDVPVLSQVLARPDVFVARASSATAVAAPDLSATGAEGLESAYLNVAVSASVVAGPAQGLSRGFDIFRLLPEWDPKAEKVTEAALEAVGTALKSPHAGDRPLFLWVHYLDPHFSYEPLEEQNGSSEEDACAKAIRTSGVSNAVVLLDLDGIASRALEDCTRRYRGEVARVDRAIHRLFDGLRQLGRAPEESLVVFTSDHGEHLGETGFFFEHGPSLHDAALRVPLIVAGPGIVLGRSNQPAELQDVAPTLMALLGVRTDAMPPMDGRSRADRWLGWESDPSYEDSSESGRLAFLESNSNLHAKVWNTVVAGRSEEHCVHEERWSLCGSGEDFETFRLYDHEADPWYKKELTESHPEIVSRLWLQRQAWPPETARERAVRGMRFKLVEVPLPSGGYERRLYDLQSDPAESRDVSADHPVVAERLGRELDEFVADLPLPGEVVRDDANLEALKALGYVD